MRLKRGFLVVFEGIDGAGKTTQAKLLYDHLKKREFDVILSKEPTDSIYGKKIKKLAQGGRDAIEPSEEYNLFMSDRRVHVANLVKPALQKQQVVILDRYYFSTIAYQGALGLNPDKIKSDNEAFAPAPEIVFLLKVPPRVGLRRIQKYRNEEPNLFEREENLTEVSRIFDLLKDNYIVPIDATPPIETIYSQVINVINDVVDHYLNKEEQYALFNDKLAL